MNLFRREGAPVAVLLAGFVLWSAVFVLLYAVQATGCRLGWQTVEILGLVTVQRAVLVLLFLAAIPVHVALYWILREHGATDRRRRWSIFAGEAGELLALAALGASIFCFAGVFWLSAC
jgi:hypothetical protein